MVSLDCCSTSPHSGQLPRPAPPLPRLPPSLPSASFIHKTLNAIYAGKVILIERRFQQQSGSVGLPVHVWLLGTALWAGLSWRCGHLAVTQPNTSSPSSPGKLLFYEMVVIMKFICPSFHPAAVSGLINKTKFNVSLPVRGLTRKVAALDFRRRKDPGTLLQI